MRLHGQVRGGGRARVPKRVNQDERRRALAEAVFAVVGRRGIEGVGLRDVAAEAGVSMGSVQHWFRTKDEMLLFALRHMRARVLARLELALAPLESPTRRETMGAALRVMLPVDPPGREEAWVNIAFFSAATANPAYAELLREGYSHLLGVSRTSLRAAADAGELAPGVDPVAEATALYFLVQGLIGPVLVGVLDADEALDVVEHQLDRLFPRPGGPVARQ
jgi:AcrR family transcriptional regulator